MTVQILYDGDCPVCSRYVRYARMKAAVGDLQLVNARESPALVRAYREQGLDINTGIIVTADGQTYWGRTALYMLAMLSTRSSLLNRIVAEIMRQPMMGQAAYFLMQGGRRLLLLMLDRKLIP